MTTTENLPAVPDLTSGRFVRITVEVEGSSGHIGLITEHRPEQLVTTQGGFTFTALEDFVVALVLNGEIAELAFARHELLPL